MELSEEAKAEIKEAIRILREDGVHIHKTYKQFMDSQRVNDAADTGEKLSETGEKLGGEDTEGSPPPEKPEEKTEKQEKAKKAGLWWGDRSE